jgi:hypothetical protein
VYQQFDNLNHKYSPFQMTDMQQIFLKTNNELGGSKKVEVSEAAGRLDVASLGIMASCSGII